MKKENNNKSKKVLAFFLGLIVLGASAFGGVYYWLSKNNDTNAQEVVEEAYYELGEIFVNLSDDGGKKYVKLTATVSYDNKSKDLAEELEAKKVALRDAAIFYFKSKTVNDFKSENELTLKKGLIEAVNRNLTNGALLDVKFSELLIQ